VKTVTRTSLVVAPSEEVKTSLLSGLTTITEVVSLDSLLFLGVKKTKKVFSVDKKTFSISLATLELAVVEVNLSTPVTSSPVMLNSRSQPT
jgi:hypothetical protein